jgi:broad specificity phosphatase PhoE
MRRTNETVTVATRLILLRHAEVDSHRGDVPVTGEGRLHAERTGKALGARVEGPVTVLFGGTRRTRETADSVVDGIGDRARVDGPADGFALRNPDVYLAGTRVDMVSSHASLAAQVAGMTEQDAAANAWWTSFIDSADRIGLWLHDEDPPGDTAENVAARVLRFARTLGDPGPLRGRTVIGITHSPVLRAVLLHATGRDPGEPGYLTGADLVLEPGKPARITALDPLTNDG